MHGRKMLPIFRIPPLSLSIQSSDYIPHPPVPPVRWVGVYIYIRLLIWTIDQSIILSQIQGIWLSRVGKGGGGVKMKEVPKKGTKRSENWEKRCQILDKILAMRENKLNCKRCLVTTVAGRRFSKSDARRSFRLERSYNCSRCVFTTRPVLA